MLRWKNEKVKGYSRWQPTGAWLLSPRFAPLSLATDEARRREEKARLASIEQERTNEPARLAAEKANSEKTKAKALAKLNTLLGWASVNVRYQEWTKTRGSISSIERTADDVTVRQSGARAYIIFSDGTSIFKPTKCVTVFDQTGNPLAFLD